MKMIRGIVMLSALLLSLASGESTTNQEPKPATLDLGTTASTSKTLANMTIKIATSDTTDTTTVKTVTTVAELESTCINDTTPSVTTQMIQSPNQESSISDVTASTASFHTTAAMDNKTAVSVMAVSTTETTTIRSDVTTASMNTYTNTTAVMTGTTLFQLSNATNNLANTTGESVFSTSLSSHLTIGAFTNATEKTTGSTSSAPPQRSSISSTETNAGQNTSPLLTNSTLVNTTVATIYPNPLPGVQTTTTSTHFTNATETSSTQSKQSTNVLNSTAATIVPNQFPSSTLIDATETTISPSSSLSNKNGTKTSTQSNQTTIALAPTEATVGPNSTQSNQTTGIVANSTSATIVPNPPSSTLINSTVTTIIPTTSPSTTSINTTEATSIPTTSPFHHTTSTLTNATVANIGPNSTQSNQTTNVVANSTAATIVPTPSPSSTFTNTTETTIISTRSPFHQTTSSLTNATETTIGQNSTQSNQTTNISMNVTEVVTSPISFPSNESTSAFPNTTATTDSTSVAITTPGQIICPPSFFFNKSSSRCDDIDECVIPGICPSPQIVCKNLVGNYSCSCPKGFKFQSESCLDINECEDRNDNCSSLGNFTCKNTIGSFSCVCKKNFTKESDGNCHDVNECALNLHNCDQICINTDGGYNCSCVEGFTYNQTISKCTNVTEPCKSLDCGVGKGVCIPGSNDTVDKCHCFGGYNMSASSGLCENINECKFISCEAGSCIDDTPGFHCVCETGFIVSNETGFCSIDINECDENPDICGNFSKCTNSRGNYSCKCLDGYETERSDGKHCHEIDGCARNNDYGNTFCSTRNRKCISNLGRFVCSSCIPPFIDQGPDTICTSVDTISGTIVNGNIALLREYNSMLKTGFSKYQLEEELRIALTEALQQSGTPNVIGFGLLNVRNGSVVCDYTMQLDGEVKTDVVTNVLVKSCANVAGRSGSCFLSDKLVVKTSSISHTEYVPCESDSAFLCSEKGNCSSVKKGSYICTCQDGYEDMNIHDNVTNCVDKNECEQSGICGSALCINEPGSFFCKCPDCQRYNSKSGLCEDICHNGGKCEAFDNSENYYCRCNSEYEGPLCNEERGYKRNVAIVGGVLGAALAIVLIVCAVLIFRLKKVKKSFSSCEDFIDVTPVRLIQLMHTDFEEEFAPSK